jgi:hypothetical protein
VNQYNIVTQSFQKRSVNIDRTFRAAYQAHRQRHQAFDRLHSSPQPAEKPNPCVFADVRLQLIS